MKINEVIINEGYFSDLGRRALLKTFGLGGKRAVQAQYQSDFLKNFKHEYDLARKTMSQSGLKFPFDNFVTKYMQKYNVQLSPDMLSQLRPLQNDTKRLASAMYTLTTHQLGGDEIPVATTTPATTQTKATPQPSASATATPQQATAPQPATTTPQQTTAQPDTVQPAKTPAEIRAEKQAAAASTAQNQMMPYSKVQYPAVWKNNRAQMGVPASTSPQAAATVAQNQPGTSQPAVWKNNRVPNAAAATSPENLPQPAPQARTNFSRQQPGYSSVKMNAPTGIPNTNIRQPLTRVQPTPGYKKPTYSAPVKQAPKPNSLAAALTKSKTNPNV